jgi:uncharacterized membrane protein
MEQTFAAISKAADTVGRFVSDNLRAILSGVAGLLALLSLAAPVMWLLGLSKPAVFLYDLLGLTCHQMPDRCFYFGCAPFALCSRCVGAYLGFYSSSYIFRADTDPGRAIRRPFLIAGALGLIDIVCQQFGVYDSSNLLRFVTGCFAGGALGMFVFRFVSSIELKRY